MDIPKGTVLQTAINQNRVRYQSSRVELPGKGCVMKVNRTDEESKWMGSLVTDLAFLFLTPVTLTGRGTVHAWPCGSVEF